MLQRMQAPKSRAAALAEKAPKTDADVRQHALANEMGLLEGALERSRERVRSFKQERRGQREQIGQTLQMALAGCQGRVMELETDLLHLRQEASERIAQLEQELTRDKRVKATDSNKDDDGTLSVGSLGSGKPGGLTSRNTALSPAQHKRAGSESRRIAELENELTAMHVKVDVQQKEIELLRTTGGSGGPANSGNGGARHPEQTPVGLRDIENAIFVQQQEYKAMVVELEVHVRELEARLEGAQTELGSKDGMIAAVEYEAGTARSQLLETEAVLERKNEDIQQLTSHLQACILELKTLSEKSREQQSRQRNVFESAGARANGARANITGSFYGSQTAAAVVDVVGAEDAALGTDGQQRARSRESPLDE